MTADLILINGKVATMSPVAPVAEALVVKEGRLVEVGTNAQARDWLGRRTEVIDAQGRRVVPGFIDSHMHLLGFGQTLRRLDLSQARTSERVAEEVRQAAQRTPAGEWIIGRGWDETRFPSGQPPLRQQLDAAAPEHPVLVIRHCGHVAAANTRALVQSGVWDGESPVPASVPGGVIDRDATGLPTGVLREQAMEPVMRAIPEATDEDLADMLAEASQVAARAGITSLHPNDGAGLALARLARIYRRVAEHGRLAVRVWWDFPVEALDDALAAGWRSGQGDDLLKIGAVKFFTDGSLGGRTAALRAPYQDDPDNRGVLLWQPDALAERMRRALSHGFQVAVHAIGDAAVDQTLDALQAARGSEWRVPRHAAVTRARLIHCQIMQPEQFARMRRLGVVADVQPRFICSDYPIIAARVGDERARSSYAWRSLWQAGVPVAFGSDCPVEPIEPMVAIYAAVTRQTLDGEPPGGWLPHERFTVDEALRAHTWGGAYAVGEEREKGLLAPGYLADFVVLDADPYAVPPEALPDIRSQRTVRGGVIVA